MSKITQNLETEPSEQIYPPATIKNFEEQYKNQLIDLVNAASGKRERHELQNVKNNYDAFWVATDSNDNVVGCAGFSRISEEIGRLRRMAIAKGWRRKGMDGNEIIAEAEKQNRLSRLLILQVLSFAKQSGSRKVYLRTNSANTGAKKLYAEAGFKEVEDTSQLPEKLRKEVEAKRDPPDCAFEIEIEKIK